MDVQRIMTSKCGFRIIVLILVSLATGFVSGAVLDSVAQMRYAESVFAQESMRDTLWLEFAGREPYEGGYNAYWIDNINAVKAVAGVKGIGVQVEMFDKDSGTNVLAISSSIVSRMNIPLSSGEWNQKDVEHGIFPAVVSYDLSKDYPIGTTVPMVLDGYNEELSVPITIKVVGIMNEYGGLPRLNTGQFVSNPSIRNILFWHNLQNTLIIPLDTLPWRNEIGYQIASVLAIHMTNDVAVSDEKRAALQESLYEKGFGLSNTGHVLAQRVEEMEAYNAGRNRLLIFVFILLTVAGVVCYNIAFAYNKRRDLSVLRLLGVTKRRIAMNWMAMIAYSHVLMMLAGLFLSQMLLSNGQTCVPQQVKWQVLFAGFALIMALVYWWAYRIMSTDIATSVREDQ